MSDDLAPVFAMTRGHNDLGFRLYAQLHGKRNFAMSPASIALATSLVYAGARGRTATQLANALGTSLGPAEHAALAGQLLRIWRFMTLKVNDWDSPPELAVANRVFGRTGLAFEPAYLDIAARDFIAPLESLDFGANPDACRQHINAWIATRTHERIRDLLPLGSIGDGTLGVLVNALYFKAPWQRSAGDTLFPKQLTAPEPFHLEGGGTAVVPTMHTQLDARFAECREARVLELGYRDCSLAFFVVLPRVALAEVEAALCDAWIDAWYRQLTSRRVSLALPKFRVEPSGSMSLREPFEKLGVTDAFSVDDADLRGIAPPWKNRPLSFSDAFHKAFVEIDERGTEAAAATASALFGAGLEPPEPISFVVDRPFLFLIGDTATRAVLFVGRVVNPAT
jgi:serpin B